MSVYEFTEGSVPLLVSMPHDGTAVPEDIAARMTPDALRLPDTDWHVSRLYDFVGELGASVLRPRHSRYVVDLNRPPDGSVLYPGASNTEVCPLLTFDNAPIYRPRREPSAAEIEVRLTRYWRPYHDALRARLDALRARFGVAVLFEAHSIRSQVPRFFAGRLPDFNLGTAGGTSCDASLEARCAEALAGAHGYTLAINGRFQGGFITRHYGDPAAGIHALQLEQAQLTYMEEAHPFRFVEERAARVQPVLRGLFDAILAWVETRRALISAS